MTCHKVANPDPDSYRDYREQSHTKINLILFKILVNFLMSEANKLSVLCAIVAVNFADISP